MRVQLALNVRNLDEAVEFYSTLFGVGQFIVGATVREILLLFVTVVFFWWIGRTLRPSGSSRGPVPGVAS